MSKAYMVPTPFASTPRKMSKPDQSARQDLTYPLPSDAVSKVHLNTRCYYGVQNSLLFTAWHSDCLLFWVCNPNWSQITHFVTHKIKYIFHKQLFNNIFSQAHFLQHFTREIFPQVLPFVARFSCLSGNLDILYYKSYILLFLLEISSALAQNIIKVGRKTFMPGKI